MDAAAVTAITGSVDFASIVTGIGTVFGAVAVVYVAIKGGRALMRAIG